MSGRVAEFLHHASIGSIGTGFAWLFCLPGLDGFTYRFFLWAGIACIVIGLLCRLVLALATPRW